MACTCRIDHTSHPYGNTVAVEEVVTQCEECRRADLLELVLKHEWAFRTICENADRIRLVIDNVYDVDNHRMPNQTESPFNGAGEVMEALEELHGVEL